MQGCGEDLKECLANLLACSGCSINGSSCYHCDSYHCFLLAVRICQWQSSRLWGQPSCYSQLTSHCCLPTIFCEVVLPTLQIKQTRSPEMEIVTGIKPPGKSMDGDIWKRAELPLCVQTKRVKHWRKRLTYWVEKKMIIYSLCGASLFKVLLPHRRKHSCEAVHPVWLPVLFIHYHLTDHSNTLHLYQLSRSFYGLRIWVQLSWAEDHHGLQPGKDRSAVFWRLSWASSLCGCW